MLIVPFAIGVIAEIIGQQIHQIIIISAYSFKFLSFLIPNQITKKLVIP
ncbi:hypothetical protein oki361_16920 [Helicobacter pylori]